MPAFPLPSAGISADERKETPSDINRLVNKVCKPYFVSLLTCPILLTLNLTNPTPPGVRLKFALKINSLKSYKEKKYY